MINIAGFSRDSLDNVNQMLYAEGRPNPLVGQCNQKQKKEAAKEPRTPEEQRADQARSQASSGRDNVPSATRSEAAKKAAETRKRCRTGLATPASPSASSTVA